MSRISNLLVDRWSIKPTPLLPGGQVLSGAMPTEPAYPRLQVDERRRQPLYAGAALFAQHSYEEISMRDIARAAGVSKPLLYHYFPSKIDLFKAAVGEHAAELQSLIETATGASAAKQL